MLFRSVGGCRAEGLNKWDVPSNNSDMVPSYETCRTSEAISFGMKVKPIHENYTFNLKQHDINFGIGSTFVAYMQNKSIAVSRIVEVKAPIIYYKDKHRPRRRRISALSLLLQSFS